MSRDDPDPERSERAAERIDARHYGDDPDDLPAHVAPPCDECGESVASIPFDGTDYCEGCAPVDRLLAAAGAQLRQAAQAATEQGVPVAADAAREATTVSGLIETVVNYDGDQSDD